jgi:putative ABC transport system ATP-binding protein
MENSTIIRIEKLVKKFPMGKGEFTALNGIDLTVDRGEFAGLIGPSGSGKTTLLMLSDHLMFRLQELSLCWTIQ